MGVVQASVLPRTRTCASLRARHRDEGVRGVLELSGEADIATLALLRDELAEAIGRHGDHLVLDVTDLRFCDVHSAHMILMACRMTPIRLTGATGSVERVFDLLQAIKQGLYTSSGYTGPVPGHSDAAWPQLAS